MLPSGSPEAAESTSFSGSCQPVSKQTVSKVSFADRSRSRTSTGDMKAMKEFFDFSAAARTDDRSASSRTHLTSAIANPRSKEPSKTRKRREVTSDTKSESSAISIHNLAGAVRDQGQHDEPRALYYQLLEIEKRKIGSGHPWTLITQANLVSVLDCLGEDGEAEALSRVTLEARERILGAQHTSTLASKNQLARLWEDRGEYVEALQLYGNVLEARSKVLGEYHELTVPTMTSAARVESAITEDAESVYSV